MNEDPYFKTNFNPVPNISFVMQSTNLYVYCANNPTNYVDPSGAEYVVASGGAYSSDLTREYNYEFIEPAIKKIREWRNDNDTENISWFIANAGWTDEDWIKFRNSVKGLNINVYTMDNISELMNYINLKTTSPKDYSNTKARDDDKITKLATFSHGIEDNISFGYGHDNSDSLKLGKSDISSIMPSAFDNPNSYFGSCNTGTGDYSFAQLWVDQVSGKTWAFVGQSTYANINSGTNLRITASRHWNGFSYHGSNYYPEPGKDHMSTGTYPYMNEYTRK